MQINNNHSVAAVQLQQSWQLHSYVQYRVMSEISDSGHIQYRSVELALRSEDEDAYQPELSESSEDEDNENTSNLDEYSADGTPVADAQTFNSEHEHSQKEFWHNLFYCQFYNIIKKIFVAS
ncbi:conserved hypothetical protein [Coccidioides posadasii str. Silveira]|uniref:Uncharacterized protein n=1 Tax=Coccidioides posadasii (strain RMSCC 757 / Silveira) TaxID=443226 RepID=E9D747_COCPS|nr:conserved hypothetical protein [Coccidioides posadasii str. Silveira]